MTDPIDPTPQRSRGGMLPIPHRNWTTKGGTRVSVGGCCLPLPLGCLTTVGAVGVLAMRWGMRAGAR